MMPSCIMASISFMAGVNFSSESTTEIITGRSCENGSFPLLWVRSCSRQSCAVGAHAETFPRAIDMAQTGGKRVSWQNGRKVSIEIRKIFVETRPAHITIRTDQHVLAITAAIRGCKIAEGIQVNFGGAIFLRFRTHIDAFNATQPRPVYRATGSKQPQPGKMRASKNIEQPNRAALDVSPWGIRRSIARHHLQSHPSANPARQSGTARLCGRDHMLKSIRSVQLPQSRLEYHCLSS